MLHQYDLLLIVEAYKYSTVIFKAKSDKQRSFKIDVDVFEVNTLSKSLIVSNFE